VSSQDGVDPYPREVYGVPSFGALVEYIAREFERSHGRGDDPGLRGFAATGSSVDALRLDAPTAHALERSLRVWPAGFIGLGITIRSRFSRRAADCCTRARLRAF
jgi:hypothetical protein